MTNAAEVRALQISASPLDRAISSATGALLSLQRNDGHWVFELEADATIPSEYILLTHYLGETTNPELELKIGAYLQRIQGAHGGWPLYFDGAFDLSASVKAYFALKMIGHPTDAPHMLKARTAVIAHGGAARANVFTRYLLALFGELPWEAAPTVPVELILLPRWFPVHLTKMSYWARTVLVPLLVLLALRPRARNPRNVHIPELFGAEGPAPARAPHQNRYWAGFFRRIDGILKVVEPLWPKRLRNRAIKACVSFVSARINGVDGLGAIYPAIANSVMMYEVLGFGPEHPERKLARAAIEKLLVIGGSDAYCQPCVSPIWDTALVCHTLMETGEPDAGERVREALAWLEQRQVLDVAGDWAVRRPDVRPGGWAFQYNNAHYPDLDDTAVVVMALDRGRRELGMESRDDAIPRGVEWVSGLRSRNGGFASFDADNVYYYLNNIPFADHGALLDPPTADVSGRCIGMLAQVPIGRRADEIEAPVAYLKSVQEKDGSWFGRWGVNYIYGTWSALAGLNAAGLAFDDPAMSRAAEWLIAIQNSDGGWGESCDSYRLDYSGYEPAPSTASQTAWALLGLMAAGRVNDSAVDRGVDYLLRTQNGDGLWDQRHYTGGGFPRVFYLRYHGYPKFFPLWALARYRNLRAGNMLRVPYGL